MSKGLGFRMESLIGFQSKEDPFVTGFVKILESIREKIKTGWMGFEVSRDEDAMALRDLINNRFKINVNLVAYGTTAAVIPFFANDNNVLMREFFRQTNWIQSEKDFFKTDRKGWVDIDNAVLGGDFSKGKSTLYLDFNVLINKFKLTNLEIVAVALHEIGHIFYPLVYATQIDKSNLILEDARRELQGDKKDKREIARKTISKLTGGDATKYADDLCSTNPDIATKAVIKLIGEQTLQHQVNAKYTNTNFEALADNFAARFGLGKEIVTALEKLTPGGVRYGDVVRAWTETLAIVANIFAIVSFVRKLQGIESVIAKAIYGVVWWLFRGIAVAVFFYVLVRTSGESSRDYTYDDLVHRYNRIRMQLIADIKERKLNKRDATSMIESIDTIGNLIKQGRNWRTPLDILFNTINPADRRAKDSIGRQQALEAMVNNDLFLSSLKLNQLAA